MSKISIIVPVYNVEKYIEKCILSIKNQTFKDFECIVVDDGSTDQSISIAKSIVENDSRFIFLVKQNGGLSSARNFGLKEVTGDYITFIDSDDSVDVLYLESMMQSIEDADICVSNYYFVSKSGRIIEKFRYPIVGKFSAEEILPKFIEAIEFKPNAWGKIYRKELFNNIKFPEGLLYEDLATTYQLVHISKKIVFIEDYLLNYIVNENSITRSYNFNKIYDRFKVLEGIKNYLVGHNLFKKYLNNFINSYLHHVYVSSIIGIIKGSGQPKSDIQKFNKLADNKYLTIKNILRYYFQHPFKYSILLFIFKINPRLVISLFRNKSN